MSIKFIHTGDLHFGVENYGRIDPDTGLHSRFKDFIKCFHKAIDYAIKHKVDFFLICGDIYHTAKPTPTQQREFAKAITELTGNSIPVIMIVGNHDNPVAFGKATSLDIYPALNIENVHVISIPQILHLDLRGKKIQILGFPWPSRSRLMNKDDYRDLNAGELDEKLQKNCMDVIDSLTSQLSQEIPSVFAGHLAISEAQYSGSEKTTLLGKDPVFLTGSLARKSYNYVALGHIHKHQILSRDPQTVYSGSIERVDFNEEKEEKGFCLVEIEENETLMRFIKTPSRKLLTINVDVREKPDPTWEIITEIEKFSLEGAIVRIIYLTTCENDQPLRLKEINDALSGAYWVHGIIKKTEEKEIKNKVIISEDLSLMEALGKYIEQEKLDKYEEDLKIYAKQLEEEVT